MRRFNNWIRYSRLVNLISGPKTLPILGNFLQLNVSSTDEFLKRIHFEWVEKYGSIYRFWAGTNPMVAISSPELMEPVLSNRQLITKPHEYSFMNAFLGDSILVSKGNKWMSRRKLLNPAFHYQITNTFVSVFNQHGSRCADVIEASLTNDSRTDHFNILPIMTKCLLDILCVK